jgi:outer membrane scaffolding protein for murein synthesis (MipA/OmpV family)
MKTLLASLLLAVPAAALAQLQVAPDDYTLLGAAVRTRPAYDGSKSQVTDVVPVVRYYGQRLFARTTQGILEGGARWNLGSGVNAGVQLAYEEGRDTGESAFLRNRGFNGDVDASGSLGAHVEWDTKVGPAPVALLVRYRQDVDSDRGALADFRFNVGLYGQNSTIVAAFLQATWASSKANATFFGVSAAQAAATGLPAFQPGGGIQHVGLGVLASHDLSRHWTLVGSISQRWLQGDAAESPLAERTRSNYANAGLAYHF